MAKVSFSPSLLPLLLFARISGLFVALLVFSWALAFKSSFLPHSSSQEDLIYSSRLVTKFTEDFDFMAMNEKFKKDEAWGHLGKSSKSHSRDKEGDGRISDEDDFQDEDDADLLKFETKPVYNKEDFFDSLSCNALDHDPHNGRTRFSEQMKIDTETFGEFSRHRCGRGGRGPGRGGRSRGPYYGRGYGYVGRGRGRGQGVPGHVP